MTSFGPIAIHSKSVILQDLHTSNLLREIDNWSNNRFQCLFVCLSVCYFVSCRGKFVLYEDVSIAIEGLQKLSVYARHVHILSRKGSLQCQIYCDIWPQFLQFHPKDTVAMATYLHDFRITCSSRNVFCCWNNMQMESNCFFHVFFCIAVLVSIAVPVFGLVNAFPDYYPYWQFKTELYSESFLLSLDK